MIKGHEIYGNEWFGAEHLAEVVERLQQKFPPLDQSEISIHRCWHRSFDTLQQLLAAAMALEERKKQTARVMSAAVIRKQQRVYTQPVDQGILNRIPSNSTRLYEVILSKPARGVLGQLLARGRYWEEASDWSESVG